MVNINKEASTSSGSAYTTGLNKKYEETSFGGEPSGELSGTKKLIIRGESSDEALAKIKARFPKFDPAKSTFTFKLNYKGDVILELIKKGKPHLLFDEDGKINENLPIKIKKSLGPQAEEIVETNEEEIARRKKRIDELNEQLEKNSDENQKENIRQSIAEEQDAINHATRKSKRRNRTTNDPKR